MTFGLGLAIGSTAVGTEVRESSTPAILFLRIFAFALVVAFGQVSDGEPPGRRSRPRR